MAVEGGLLVLYAVAELFSLTGSRLTMGVSTAAFFALCGAALLFCAWSVTRLRAFARSPMLLAQLIILGLAWSFRGDGTTLIAVGLAVVALVTIAGLLHPDSIDALAD